VSISKKMVGRAVIIGASSGIGRAIAKILASNGYSVGLVARRGDLLCEVGAELPTPVFVIVGISSLAALRGNGEAPAYNASKAFISSYLQSLRHKFSKLKLPIVVTDVQPGLVNTAIAKGHGLFWVASPEKAARQIFVAILKRKRQVYVTRRWRFIAWFLKTAPDWLYHRL
jgi:short-subunit dehydrogenase